MSEWRDIETAPKSWTRVLVHTRDGEVCEAYHNPNDGEWYRANLTECDEDCYVDPMHWQPLPEPPRG